MRHGHCDRQKHKSSQANHPCDCCRLCLRHRPVLASILAQKRRGQYHLARQLRCAYSLCRMLCYGLLRVGLPPTRLELGNATLETTWDPFWKTLAGVRCHLLMHLMLEVRVRAIRIWRSVRQSIASSNRSLGSSLHCIVGDHVGLGPLNYVSSTQSTCNYVP